VTLTWNASAAPAGCMVSYRVYRNGVQILAPSTPSATISGLTSNTTYSFTVTAVDAAGASAQSPAVVWRGPIGGCDIVPPVPTGLVSTGVTSSSVSLSWADVTPPPECAVTYTVYRGGVAVASGLSGANATISGLSPSTPYTFTVTAVDKAGSSAQSAGLTVTTSGGGSSCAGVPAYVPGNVYWGNTQVTYNGQLWKAKWWTQNEAPSTGGSGVWQYLSDCGTVTCAAAPAVPTGLASSNVTATSVTLNWAPVTAPAGCTVTYNVYKNGSKVLTVPTTSAVVSGLAASTSYSFTVASVDSFGTSAQSAALSVKTKAEQDGPAANFDPATLAMLTANTGLNAEQWNNIMKLVSKPEQDDLEWVKYYGYCENINDGRGYTIGIFGATTGGSNDTGPDGPALFKEYDKVCGASSPSTAGGLARIGIQGYMSGSILNITESKAAFTAHIKGMENVANWRTAMWNTFYSVYIGYCVDQMQARGFTTALTLGSFVDCALNQGAEGDSGSLEGMLSQTGNISDEAAFMTQFYKVRTKVVDTNDYNQAPNGANRVKQWSTLLSQGETDLLNCDAQILSATNWVMQ